MKIAVVVHGRFHAFDLVRALLKRGNDVTVFTNYPRWAVARFGIPGDRVRSFPLHGLVARVAARIQEKTGWPLDARVHPMFGRWAAKQLRGESWDIIHAWSGISEEIYSDLSLRVTLKVIMRGSVHIRTQASILAEEQMRAMRPIDQPTRWMIAREEREYRLADAVVVLSRFSYDSFLEQGIKAKNLLFLPLGANLSQFRPSLTTLQERIRRIRSGEPLTVLYAGNISFQKGMFDMARIVRTLAGGQFRFRLVGRVMPEAKELVDEMSGNAEFISKQPQSLLPEIYALADLFVFPTIQDGYPAVLAQSQASALPALTTENCSGPESIKEGTGWVFPIRRPDLFIERLLWCHANREELVRVVESLYADFQPRDFSDVAADFEKICAARIAELAQEPARSSHV